MFNFNLVNKILIWPGLGCPNWPLLKFYSDALKSKEIFVLKGRALNQFKIEIASLVRKMRKDVADISDTSSSLLLMIESSRGAAAAQAQQQAAPQLNKRSTLEVSIDALLGELSEIKAENGIAQQNLANQLDLIQQNSSVHFNVLEGHSSVQHEESSSIPLQLPAESASELAYENV